MDPVTLAAMQFGGNMLLGGLSARSANAASGDMSRYYRLASRALEDNRNMAKDLYARYSTVYKPVEDKWIGMAQTAWNPDYAGAIGRATSDYTRSREQVRAEAMRTNARMGVDPSNPMYTRGINRTNVSDALALSTARNMAREAERQRAVNGRYQAYGDVASRGFQNIQAAGNLNSGAASGFSGMGNTYGQLAGSNASAAGYFMNQGLNSLGGWKPGAPAGGGYSVRGDGLEFGPSRADMPAPYPTVGNI